MFPNNRTYWDAPSHSVWLKSSGVFFLGFLSIACQLLLLREIFCVLNASDIAVTIALTAWTAFTACGAWIAAMSAHTPSERVCSILLFFYVAIVIAIALLLRSYSSHDVLSVSAYLRIPLLLVTPCVVSGALFPWYTASHSANENIVPVRISYALETFGGMIAGFFCGAHFFLGGSSSVIYITLLGVSLIPAASLSPRGLSRKLLFTGVAVCLLSASVQPFGRLLDRLTFRLAYPDNQILAHTNSAYVPLTAVKTPSGSCQVYVHGLPSGVRAQTPDMEAIATLLANTAHDWGNVLIINPVSSGILAAVDDYRNCSLYGIEADRTKAEFLEYWLPSGDVGRIRLATSLNDLPASLRFDPVIIAADAPASLLDNRYLTSDYFQTVLHSLAPDGVIATLLPIPPGFVDPRHRRSYDAVTGAMTVACTRVKRLDTELGWSIMLGSTSPVSLDPRPDLSERITTPALDSLAELENIEEAQSLRDALFSQQSKEKNTESDLRIVNSVSHPYAYLQYILFFSSMVEGAPPFYIRLLTPKPFTYGLFSVLLIVIAVHILARRNHSMGSLFWASWLDTSAVILSVYVYQSAVGQAYWATSILIAGNLSGILLATVCNLRRAGYICVLALLYTPVLALALPFASEVNCILLLTVEFLGCLWTGLLAGHAFVQVEGTSASSGRIFAVDLFGSAAGFLFGGGILIFWHGIPCASYISAGAVIIGLLSHHALHRHG